jgi:hypothetical protein
MGNASADFGLVDWTRRVSLFTSLMLLKSNNNFSLNFVLLSQLEESHYVRLGFATSDTNICIVQSSNPNKEEDPGSCSGSRFVFSQRPFSAHLLHYMASGISILDQGFVSPNYLSKQKFYDHLFFLQKTKKLH